MVKFILTPFILYYCVERYTRSSFIWGENLTTYETNISVTVGVWSYARALRTDKVSLVATDQYHIEFLEGLTVDLAKYIKN